VNSGIGGMLERDKFLRRTLWVSVAYNFAAAMLFAFPASSLGRLAGLPAPVPPVYSALVAFFVALFGAAYAWLACQPAIDRPLVAFAAIGKTGVFVLIFVLWLLGSAPSRGVLAAIGDLALAGVFFSWLLRSRDRA
jgi:hypothetical protein